VSATAGRRAFSSDREVEGGAAQQGSKKGKFWGKEDLFTGKPARKASKRLKRHRNVEYMLGGEK